MATLDVVDRRASRKPGPASRPHASAIPCRFLIVEDDPDAPRTLEQFLRSAGFNVATVSRAAAALDAARSTHDVILISVHSAKSAVLGSSASNPRDAKEWPRFVPPMLAHWADAIAKGIGCRCDPKSIALWAHAIGQSESSVRGLCALTGISAKHSRDLLRILRAVYLSRRSGRVDVSEWLDVADARTLKRLLVSGGIAGLHAVSIDAVLLRQTLVSNHAAIALLSRALRREGVA